ncbi:hypothetical protein EYC80_002492 [Monilinia laxa]|uniref:Uncharacterized protein n=1 Tax=Monilinia laxa TaxID=61186 RepID=A0A5N6K458_MONLA|nr:hypothetical protein EYC80_002492 [Monilinia laxa]
MRRSKFKATTPLEPATQQDEIQPCERSFMLDVAEMDYIPREVVETRVQDERSGEAFITIPQSNNDALENHDNDNINYSTNDSDSDHYNGHNNEKLKKKRKIKGRTDDNNVPNRTETTENHVNNTEENHPLHHEELKWRARVWKFCHGLKLKKVKDGQSEVTPDFWQSPIVNESKPGEKGINCDKKTLSNKHPSSTGGKMNGVAERKGNARNPSISQSYVDAAKAVDDDNIECDEDEIQAEEEEFLYKRSRFRGQNHEVMEQNAYMVFPHFDPTASGNNRVYRVSKFRENIESYDQNAIKGGRVEMLRQERQAIGLTQQKKSASGSVSVRGPKMRDENPLTADCHQNFDVSNNSSAPFLSGPTNQTNTNFHTRTVYSVERTGEIISSHPETATINVISEMYVAPPRQPKKSTLRSKIRKFVPERIETICCKTKDESSLTEDTTERNKTKKAIRKGSDESLGTVIGRIKGFLKKKVDDSEQQTHSTIQVFRQNGTKDLERQVSKITKSVPQSCTLSRSKSIKSVELIIEGGSSGKFLGNTKDVLQCCRVLTPASGSSSSPGPSMQAFASSQSTPSASMDPIHVCYMGERNKRPRKRHKRSKMKSNLRTKVLKRSLRIEDIRELRSQRIRRAREALERASNNVDLKASSAQMRGDKIQKSPRGAEARRSRSGGN